MPAIMQQVYRLSIADRIRLAEQILKSINFAVDDAGARKTKTRRIGLMEGKWTAPSYERDRQMDAEIESMFEWGEKL